MKSKTISVAAALLVMASTSTAAPANTGGWRMESNKNSCEAIVGRFDFGTVDGKELLLGVEKGTVEASLSAEFRADDVPLQFVFLKVKGGVYATVGDAELNRLMASKRLTVTWPGMPSADVSLELFPKVIAYLAECGAQLGQVRAAAAARSAERSKRLMAIGQILQGSQNGASQPTQSFRPDPPAEPPRASPFHTYITPGGKMVTCTTLGTTTTCM